MSIDLYPARLFFYAGHGAAKAGGCTVPLEAPPQLPGLQVEAIDYAPGAFALVTPRFEGQREMYPDERAAAMRLLEQITAGAAGTSTEH